MSTITKERVAQFIKNPLDNGLTRGEQMELARIALASLEAEPVAWRNKDSGHCGTVYIQGKSPSDCGYEPLYLAPPASVSVPDDLEMKPIQTDDGQIVGYEYLGERYGVTAGCAWNTAIRTFRAAMLQGADGNSQWVACSERMPPQGDYVSVVSRHGEYVSGLVNDEWLELHDGTSFGMDEIYLWVPLPAAPKQEVKS